MRWSRRKTSQRLATSALWGGTAPVRDELFGVERLEQHAESLAAAQPVTTRPPRVPSLRSRLDQDATVLLAAYRASAAELEGGRTMGPAAAWLLDNYHVVEEQVREVRESLPPRYYRELPKLAGGPFEGTPRVLGIAWAFVAHTDSNFDPEVLRRFVAAYQRVEPLTIGELWAVAITLRFVLIENLRRVADQIAEDRLARFEAEVLADLIERPGSAPAWSESDLTDGASDAWSDAFIAQLAKRLRDQDPSTLPAPAWLEAWLEGRGTSIDEVVLRSQQREGAANVTVRNIITSMRRISDTAWVPLFERMSLVDARLRASSGFQAMDLPTRDRYRNALEELARGSVASELRLTELVLEAARAAANEESDVVEAERKGDPGYHLIGRGRRTIERAIGFRPTIRLRVRRALGRVGLPGYIGAISLLTLALVAFALWISWASGLAAGWLVAFGLVLLFPATEVATAAVHRLVMGRMGTRRLPALDLVHGVPASSRTLVVVPTLLSGEDDLMEQVQQLEVHFLTGARGDLSFALLSDGADAATEVVEGEEDLLAKAAESIDELNRRHGHGPSGPRFLLLHRRRVHHPGEGVWMGWERKRGKLFELNRLLRGATDTTFLPIAGQAPRVPTDVRYVITLDADTRMPRDAAHKLIGKMAHPLNRPRFSEAAGRVVDGYGVLQPRVTASLPPGRGGSIYHRVFSAPSGMDPYAAAVSDVYQDLFGEGSYTGKGIYDVDAFMTALAGRVPENTMLSHDLFEGIFARAGLASDVEVVEESPSRYDVDVRRHHRWTRGDWQLLPWALGRWRGAEAVPALGRWKMLDNLRRSLVAPLTLAALVVAWLLHSPSVVILLLAGIVIPTLLPAMEAVLPRRPGVRLSSHLAGLLAEAWRGALRALLAVAFLADEAWRMGDAIWRTLLRLFVTRRRLLEWTTAAESMESPRPTMAGYYRRMAGGTALGVVAAVGASLAQPASLALALPFGLLWLAAPALATWVSGAPREAKGLPISEADALALRLTARRTWRYFETFVTELDHMLPPDNFQEDPKPVIAHRTSPTNIGLYLLSAAVARDLGWAGTSETVERLEATLAVMDRLPRYRGHFYNWYDTRDLRVLDPVYVSSVDSGNLAGHLIALANACENWAEGLVAPKQAMRGLADDLGLARSALAGWPGAASDLGRRLAAAFDRMAAILDGSPDEGVSASALQPAIDEAIALAGELSLEGDKAAQDLAFWTQALAKAAAEHRRDRSAPARERQALRERLTALAGAARGMAMAMDFGFLLDDDRKLLSIGYVVADQRLDASCYDLLASEARLASLFAIAKGDIDTRHWFRMGRTATPVGSGSVLISWSGSMFEYLMPQLVMHAPVGSLLEQSQRLAVRSHQTYGRSLGVPWGSSESAYNARDVEFTYQYGNFGMPGLGLKRGLSDDLVVAPYATGLASMVDPRAARRNYDRLAGMGALGRYGFFEAVDFTRSRVPSGRSFAVVRSFMAHHQGMTIVAIANAVAGGRMRELFHREPMIQASELLLQERLPRDVTVVPPRAAEVTSPTEAWTDMPSERRLGPATVDAPLTHLLSNGHYTVMLTAAGAGYSRWDELAVTRWQEDATRDEAGSFVFLKDVESGALWSAAARPLGGEAEDHEVVLAEDHAQFIHRGIGLKTVMDVLVTHEGDGEVRRVSLSNSGRQPREIELTSYAEMVLTDQAGFDAHPAFAKMFVQTEHLAETGVLIAHRRPRSAGEAGAWAAHLAVVEGEALGEAQFETDRARFLGRGRSMGRAAAIHHEERLSGTAGTVLDPVFSLRHRLRVAPGRVARVAFWTLVAPTREELLDLVDKHMDPSAFERAKTLAWTQAQLQLRYLDVSREESAAFQRLTAPILYADPRFRASAEAIARGAGPQSGLWPHAISGDLPIVLLRIDDESDLPQVRQLLRAQEYWHTKRLEVDLVIVNEHASSYLQDLQAAIEAAVRSSMARPRLGVEPTRGAVHALRADLMTVEARALLLSVARVVLAAHRGPVSRLIARLKAAEPRRRSGPVARPPSPLGFERPELPDLEFFNGLGGFTEDGREYLTLLEGDRTTPAPWINVIANPGFGFQVSAEGSGSTWAENSREHRLSPWSNDPVSDPVGEAIYLRDEDSGELWSAAAQPIRDGGSYLARHGHGYSRFEHQANGIHSELLQFVPLHDPIKVSRLRLHNRSGTPRRLSVTAYTEWVLGTVRGATAPFLITEMDEASGAMLARNPWSTGFPGRVAFADLAGGATAWTADRTEFLGRGGGPSAPAALLGDEGLSGAVGAGLDPCAALQRVVEIGTGETVVLDAFLGACASAEEAQELLLRYREADLDAVLAEVKEHWAGVLGAIQVKTPDRALDIMVNGWLLYQTLACRIWARSAFYQASGAYGFRDQLQDGMALTFVRPEETRRHLLRAAGRQFVEGDVQHWWLPQSGQGVRTHISDDRVWLAYAAATYVRRAGDEAVLDELVPFIEGPALPADEHDAFFQPMVADESASLFEHCARGLDLAVEKTGERGLPLMGTGDWNDGMDRVGAGGRGESVWLGWMLVQTLEMFVPLARRRGGEGDLERALRWSAHAESVREAIEREAWDGEWYRRATFDDGSWLGSKQSEACRIDSIAQSWAVLSGAGDDARAATAMASLERHLVRRDDGLVLLFTPPFDDTALDPGYIKGYPPGLRENGGQYSHAAMWAILAFAEMGEVDKAAELFTLINPVRHAATPEGAERYKVEPYVVAADVYSVPPHVGRGGWTWYTGSAGWMHRAAVEGILGIRREGDELVVAPRLPAAWPGFEAVVTLASTHCTIHVEHGAHAADREVRAVLDGVSVSCSDGVVHMPLDGGRHRLKLRIPPREEHGRSGDAQLRQMDAGG